MAIQELNEFLGDVKAFSAFTPDGIKKLEKVAKILSFKVNAPVFEQGTSGEGLYLVREGTFRLYEQRGGVEKSIGLRKPGELIGEIAALKDVPLENSVRAATTGSLVLIPRDELTRIAKEHPDAERFLKQFIVLSATGNLLSRFMNLAEARHEDLERVVNSIGMKRIADGTQILEQGTSTDKRLYVVQSGLVRLERTHGDDDFTIGLLDGEEVFGEKSCLKDVDQPETAFAAKDTIVLIIPQDTVRFMIDRNPALKTFLDGRITQRDQELERQIKMHQRRSPRALIDLITPKRMRDKVIDHFPMVEQADDEKSGAACLGMICKHYQVPVSNEKLIDMVAAPGKGGETDAVTRIAESMGFSCKSIKCSIKMLQTFDIPFIAMWKGYRFVVIYGISKRHVWIADPSEGFKRLSIDEFQKGWDGQCLAFMPSEVVEKREAGANPWVRFVRMLVPQRGVVRDVILATVVIELLGLVSPLLTQAVVDKVLVHSNQSLLNVLIIGALMALTFTNATRIARSYLINFLIRKIDFTMMSRFYKHILALPVSFFARRKVGDIMACFNENTKIRQFMTFTAINAIMNSFVMIVYLGVMFSFNAKLSLAFLAFMPILVILTALATPKYAANARTNYFAQADARAILTESLGASQTIKALGLEMPLRNKWEEKYAHAVNMAYKTEFFASTIRAIGIYIRGALSLVILWYGAILVINQELSVGQLMAFIQIVACVMTPLIALINSWNQLYATGVSIERITEIMEIEPEQTVDESNQRAVLTQLRGHVKLENVSFDYGGPNAPSILKGVNLELHPGMSYAIVGASGAGKSTLGRLITGLYKPTEGRMFIDDNDITSVDLPSYRAQIGYVMQENDVFAGTLAENIAIGDPSPNYAKIEEVGAMACLEDVVKSSPLRYELTIGERGSGLSNGQIQRLCIARALYHEPKLLILDEPTASLEEEMEELIFDNLKETLDSRTSIIISHRLGTILRADKIIVMAHGGIAEEGTHDELIERNGIYAKLMNKQIKLLELSPPE